MPELPVSRRTLLALLPAALVLCPSPGVAQRVAGSARVGWLSYLDETDPVLSSLREGLRELGYVEGKSFVVVPRFAQGDFTRLPRLVEELAAERLDVVVSARALDQLHEAAPVTNTRGLRLQRRPGGRRLRR